MSRPGNQRSNHEPPNPRPVPTAFEPPRDPVEPKPGLLRQSLNWALRHRGVAITAVGVLLTAVIGVIVSQTLDPEVDLAVRVVEPTRAELLELPRGKDAQIVAQVSNSGGDTAEDVTVRIDGNQCKSVDVNGGEDVRLPCTVSKDTVSDDASQVKVTASDAGEIAAVADIDVKWEDLKCPDYATVITDGQSIVGKSDFATLRERWNAAVRSFASPACGTPLDEFDLELAEPGTPGDDVLQSRKFGSIIVEFDKNRPKIVDRVKITSARPADRSLLKRLLAVVAAENPEQAERFESSRAPLDPPEAENGGPDDGATDLVKCGSIVPGVELVTKPTENAATSPQLILQSCRS